MGIKADKKRVSVDFDYNEKINDQDVQILVKLHYTDEYGQTISFCVDGESYIGLPAGFFAEVVDFLRQQKYITDNQPAIQTATPRTTQPKVPVVKKGKLPLPTLSSKEETQEIVESQPVIPESFDESTAIQSFEVNTNESSVITPPMIKTGKIREEPVGESEEAEMQEVETLSKDLTDDQKVAILQERLDAAKRAEKTIRTKKLKKAHKMEEDE